MKKLYERPDLEYVSLIAHEEITSGLGGGNTGLESSLGDDEWDE